MLVFHLILSLRFFEFFFYIRCQTLGFKFRLCISINFEVFVLFFLFTKSIRKWFLFVLVFCLFVWVLVLDWTKLFASVRCCWEWFRLVLFLLKFWYSNDGCIFSLYFFLVRNEGLNASISSISTCFYFVSLLFSLAVVVARFFGRKHTTL